MKSMKQPSVSERRANRNPFRKLTDTSVPLDLRITMIVALSGAVGNTVGFLANLLLYGMNFPTAFCGVCALLIILNLFFGLRSVHYMVYGAIMIVVLSLLEFPLLLLTYGAVMLPYMILGYLSVLMLTKGRERTNCCVLLGLYDVAIIVVSSLNPYIFGPQDSAGLLGSAVITYVITLSAIAALLISWQGVTVVEANDVDGLTGAYTRAGFLRNAEKRLEHENIGNYSILMFNISNFKVINTVLGSDGGDELLRHVADSIRAAGPKDMVLGRLSADHFACLVGRDRVDFGKIEPLCRFRFTAGGKLLDIQMHCGIYEPAYQETGLEAMCDKALAAAKMIHSGQARPYAVYDAIAAKNFREETELLGELETAIREKSFEPFYQPIVDCKSGKIVSAEALARWRHPERGLISPGVFIPILEKKEYISELDAIIAGKVTALTERRCEAGQTMIPISVNLSRVDLYDFSFVSRLRAMLERPHGGIPYHLELTESTYENLNEETMAIISEFRDKGAHILVDDFGSGYSSLGMIADCDFDYIKLDMSFASRLDTSENARSVVRALVNMAHNLGAKVIAEGVETASQYEFLRAADCDQVQGFFLYRPMPEADFLKLLDRQIKEEQK